MPNIASRTMQYTSDFAFNGESREISYKIKAEYANEFSTAGLPSNPPPPFSPCPTVSRLKPRHWVITLANGEVIKHPIPTREAVNTSGVLLANDPDVLCLDYIGERWITIPNTGTAGTSYTIPDGRSDKVSGTINYTSDLTNNDIEASIAIELNPLPLSNQARACAGTINENAVCSNTLKGFRTRRVIMIARNSGTQGQLRRHAPVANPTEINTCIIGGAIVAVCVGYEGERVKNAHEYFLGL